MFQPPGPARVCLLCQAPATHLFMLVLDDDDVQRVTDSTGARVASCVLHLPELTQRLAWLGKETLGRDVTIRSEPDPLTYADNHDESDTFRPVPNRADRRGTGRRHPDHPAARRRRRPGR